MFIWPLESPVVTRDFYFKDSLYVGGQHAAIDIVVAHGSTTGAPVRSIADGTAYASPIKDYYSGWNVYVEHANGWRSGYRHFEHQILPTNIPISVKRGEILGYADSTGVVTGPHLHFDLWNREKKSPEAFFKVGWWAHDPELYLGQEDEMPTPYLRFIQVPGDGTIYVTDGIVRKGTPSQQIITDLVNTGLAEGTAGSPATPAIYVVTQEYLDWLPDYAEDHSGSGEHHHDD